jgi:hypothetical protein
MLKNHMNISKQVINCVLISTLTFIAFNCRAEEQEISEIPLQNCNYEKVIYQSFLNRAKNAMLISQNSMQYVNEIQELTDKVPNNSKQPVGNYLNDSEKIRFTKASQKMESSSVSQLVESRYQRDLALLAKMQNVVQQVYEKKIYPKEGTEEHRIIAWIIALRVLGEDFKLTDADNQKCSFELAIHNLGTKSLNYISNNLNDAQKASSFYDELRKKYSMTEINESKLNSDEKNLYRNYEQRLMSQFRHELDNIRNIEALKIWSKSFQVMYDNTRNDLLISGGDIKSFGQTTKRNEDNGKYSKTLMLALTLWTKINETYPSEYVKDRQEFLKYKPK